MSESKRDTIANAMGAIAPVAKAGENKHHKYKFQRAPDLYAAVRAQLAELGICLRSVKITHTEHKFIPKRDSGQQVHALVHLTMTFTNAAGDVISEIDSVGDSLDSGDKAFRKALTFGVKAALVMGFLIPDDSIEDGDGKSPKLGGGRKQPKPKNQVSGAARALARTMGETKESGVLSGLLLDMSQFSDEHDRNWLARCYAKRLEQLTGEVIAWKDVLPRPGASQPLQQVDFPVGSGKP